ncbi:MAG: DNA polymerase III subunit delta' [Candidatus Accumulibacter sp.]|jgi:DNA polymerase-3 subunit delta'|nr:DNA polymerase III subunit delta' [Accumulibacter sp.]
MDINTLHSEAWARMNVLRPRLPHALLIAGQRGIGKFDLAWKFAQSILCEKPGEDFLPCGKCLPCGWFLQRNHPDFRLLQPENEEESDAPPETEAAGKKKPSREITVDRVRALDDFLHIGTHRQGMRIVLIHPAEAMNRNAANSLLKALEEPAPETLFLLVSSEFARLLPTIRSRCRFFSVALPKAEQSAEYLRQSGVENAESWLTLAGGSPFLADDLSREGHILLDALLAELRKGEKFAPLAAAASIERIAKADKRQLTLKRSVEWLQKWLLDLLLTREGLLPRYFLDYAKEIRRLAALIPAGKIVAFYRKSLEYRLFCEQPLNTRLFLEECFLNYAALFDGKRQNP